jgi:hypothetical protein
MQGADEGTPLQELTAVGVAAEGSMGGGVEGNWKGEESLQDPGLVHG